MERKPTLAMQGKRIFLTLLVPVAVLAAAAVVLWQWPQASPDGEKLRAFVVLLPLLPLALFVLVAAIGLRYGNAGLLLGAVAFALCYAFTGSPWFDISGAHPAYQTALFLLPLNIGLFSMLMRRRLKTAVGIGCLLAVAVQAAAVLWLSSQPASMLPAAWDRMAAAFGAELPSSIDAVESAFAPVHSLPGGKVSTATAACFAAAGLFLLIRFSLRHNALTAGLAGALAGAFLAEAASPAPAAPTIFYTASGLILTAAGVESSFTLAYTDELTGLPGRRRLNEELLNLGKRYALAMIDVDHFKKFNDRFGHDAGDQVLKMIARKLDGLSGGGRAFRYGGEEFTAVFAGKDVDEALP
jgi:GGDEF domain-containing protein